MGECLIGRRGGEIEKLPILNPDYPSDLTVWTGENATFQVVINKHGVPAEYTYKWYQDSDELPDGNTHTYTYANLQTPGTYTVRCVVTNKAGSVHSRTATLIVKDPVMRYSYTGTSEKIDDGDENWRIKLKTSGILRFTNLGKWDGNLDVFCVGGGGGCGNSDSVSDYLGAGGGGYTNTTNNVSLQVGIEYPIEIGAGGTKPNASNTQTRGGTTSAFNTSAEGGYSGRSISSGNGGSGGAAPTSINGGIDGGDGGTGTVYGAEAGKGQGTTTREFGESTGDLYSSGGYWDSRNGADNTGNGGGSVYLNTKTSTGGSGIVVIRNHR